MDHPLVCIYTVKYDLKEEKKKVFPINRGILQLCAYSGWMSDKNNRRALQWHAFCKFLFWNDGRESFLIYGDLQNTASLFWQNTRIGMQGCETCYVVSFPVCDNSWLITYCCRTFAAVSSPERTVQSRYCHFSLNIIFKTDSMKLGSSNKVRKTDSNQNVSQNIPYKIVIVNEL